MSKNILIYVNWEIERLAENHGLHPANIEISGEDYWFTKWWPDKYNVSVIGTSKSKFIKNINKITILNFIDSFRVALTLNSYDIIISNGAKVGLPLAFYQKIFRIKKQHILIENAILEYLINNNNNFVKHIIKLLLLEVSAIVAHSSAQCKFYKRFSEKLGEKCIFIPYGVDIDNIRPTASNVEDYVIVVGNAFRDFKTLIDALGSTNIDVKILSRNFPNQLKLPSNIHFCGNVSYPEYLYMLSLSKLVVLPLDDIPWSAGHMVLLESMALGKAIIVTQVDAVKDYIDDKCVLSVPPKDACALRTSVINLIANPLVCKIMGQNARENVVRNFNEEQFAARLSKLIDLMEK